MGRVTVLLTATIDPGATIMVARADPDVRMRDYQQALRSWLSVSRAFTLVFCENSGYDIGSLRKIADETAGPRIEFISLNNNKTGETKGKGHSELLAIKRAMEVSEMLSNSQIVIKCTGRLYVPNAARVLSAIESTDFDIMCALRKYLSYADSRFFAATPEFFFNHLIPCGNAINDNEGVYFEHALARAAGAAIADGMKWRPFPVLPRICGVSGTFDKSMSDSALIGAVRTVYSQVRNFIYSR
jgi:hypothetical protein